MEAKSLIFVWFIAQLCSISELIGFQQNASGKGSDGLQPSCIASVSLWDSGRMPAVKVISDGLQPSYTTSVS